MSTIKISQLGNLTTVQGNVIIPVVGNIAGTLTTVQSNVAQLQTFILGTVVTDLANLTASTTANAAVQSGAIADVTTAWQANAATQLSQITAANAAIVTANTNMKGYVDGQITTVSSSVTGANAAIVTANTALKGYVDAANTIQTNQITTVSSSVTGANAAIVTANTNMKGYVDANNATQLTSINNITNGTTTFGNITPTANVTYNLGNLTYRWNSLYTDSVSATTVNLPLNGVITGVTFEGINYSILNASNIGGAAIIAGNNYIGVTQTYANIVIRNANTAVTHTWRLTDDGKLTLPTNGTVSYSPTTSSNWAGTAPTTIQNAIDRLAAVVKALNGGTGA